VAVEEDLPPLAPVEALKDALGGVWTTQRTKQAERALASASGYLRDVIGRPITRLRSQLTLEVGDGGVLLVPGPVVEVHSVTATTGADVAHDAGDAFSLRVRARPGTRVEVDLTHGWDPVPSEVRRYTMAVAASELASLKRGSLGMAGNVANIAVEDVRVGFFAGGETSSGLELPERIVARLRANYGGHR
jgi:hypothetical protein